MLSGSLIRAMVVPILALAVSCGNSETLDQARADSAAPEALFAAPVFAAVDQYGEPFSSVSLQGHVWVASFMFTSCQTVCPNLNSKQQDLQREFAESGLKFVSISTDPENDTPEVLRKYANDYDAKPGVWHFLQLPIDSVRALSTHGFKLMDPETPEMHSTRFVLVDAKGNICGFYDAEDANRIEVLRNDVRRLLGDSPL
jgi:protein SCO1/2